MMTSHSRLLSIGEPSDGDIMTACEAAKFLKLGRNQLYEAAGRGDIPHRRIGRSYRFSRSALVAWLSCSAQNG